MLIGGLQRLSLSDFPGRLSAILFARGCNFRCRYCHNPELVDPRRFAQLIPMEEICRFLHSRKGSLDGVVFSGGEPTLQDGLVELMGIAKRLDFAVKLDTNGSRPDLIGEILARNLVDFVAMDVKAPPSSYERVAGVPVVMADIAKSIRIIMDSGIEHEFRTTYVDGLLSPEDMREIARLLRGCRRYVLQAFRPTKTLDDSLMGESSPRRERLKEMGGIFQAAGIPFILR